MIDPSNIECNGKLSNQDGQKSTENIRTQQSTNVITFEMYRVVCDVEMFKSISIYQCKSWQSQCMEYQNTKAKITNTLLIDHQNIECNGEIRMQD